MSRHQGAASQICHNVKIISPKRSLEKNTEDDPIEQEMSRVEWGIFHKALL